MEICLLKLDSVILSEMILSGRVIFLAWLQRNMT